MDRLLEESFKKQASKEKFTLKSIERLEKHFSTHLSKEYKDFLLHFGSVVIEAGLVDSFIVKYKTEERIEDVFNFLSEKEILEAYEILRTVNEYDGEAQIPAYFIPIAHTNESFHRNYILLHTEDGTIWLTMEDESMEKKIETFGFIANGFSDFLNAIDSYANLTKTNTPIQEDKNNIIPDDFLN